MVRGEYCIGAAGFFTFCAGVLLVFANIGQLNLTTVPGSIYLARVDTTAFSAGFQQAINATAGDLFTGNQTLPLGTSAGLRWYYNFGLYGYCAEVAEQGGVCTDRKITSSLDPFDAIVADAPEKYKTQVRDVISKSTFKDSSYMKRYSTAAYWLVFLGSLLVGVALVAGIIPNRWTFLLAGVAATLAALCLVIGAAILTIIIKKLFWLHKVKVRGGEIGLGIKISYGHEIWLIWAAFVAITLAIAPYLISGCTYRR